LAVILAGAALALQSANPVSIEPASQHAATEAGVTSQSSAQTAQTAGAKTTAVIILGMDVITVLRSAQPQAELYFPVCPFNEKDAPTAKMKAFATVLQTNFEGSQFGIVG